MTKHLTYDDRLKIGKYLKLNFSISKICRELNRHKSTISMETSLRFNLNKKSCYKRNFSVCVYKYDCDMDNVYKENKYKCCIFCNHCNNNYKYFRKNFMKIKIYNICT